MNQYPVPVQLFKFGYTPLVSVIPPNASLTPGSAIQASQLGKTPGRKNPQTGTWGGYGWQKYAATERDAQQWASDGANIGILAEMFPAVDIDCTDPWLSGQIAEIAHATLGPAPVRVGLPPKQLLMYRLEGAPFARMALIIRTANTEKPHLVEVLGTGRQYLIYGTHPSGRPYEWTTEMPAPAELCGLSREKVNAFFDELKDTLEMIPGVEVERVGDGHLRSSTTTVQSALEAPTMEALAAAVKLIPNTNDAFPDRDDYLKIGYAIRASGQSDEDSAFHLFLDWASRWTGGFNDPEIVHADWRRMKPPYSVGWGWLSEIARKHGYNDAADDFPADLSAPAPDETESSAAHLSDQWAAGEVIREHGHTLRFVNAETRWYVWSEGRWAPDATKLAENKIAETLARIADVELRKGATAKEKEKALTEGRRLCSAHMIRAVREIIEADPRIALRADQFDSDPWLLNTPGGMIDLKTGGMTQHKAERLCSKQTPVTPDPSGRCPEWVRFLEEATGGDRDMQEYLQRAAGYCLTGTTSEQVFLFIWGTGGNGKSLFLNVLTGLLGDYARTAAMDTFSASTSDRHPTDIAMMVGARLVSASETQAGKRWDEARMKQLTGGDPVSARFMRQDLFTFIPQFKLLFVGNHKPELRDVDRAMRRRIQLVPFTVTPRRVDPDLGRKLRAELPAILSWAIDGCLAWQKVGLLPPASVAAATEEYFGEQDAVQRWMEEWCERDPEYKTPTQALYDSWREWAGANGEYVGSEKRLVQALFTRGFVKYRDARTRGIRGLRPLSNVYATGGMD